jgi:hypothetical protein
MEILEKIKKPNLEIKVKQKNTLKHLEYYSFEERVFDLASLFKKSLNEEYTNIIGSNVYVSREFGEKNKVFNGVYKLASIENYMGFIPEKNQIEINEKFQSLNKNPFLTQKFKILILAPLNNFAEENNIKAIDPIAFAYFEEGENCYKKNCLITLSQWI